ncbi:MAG: FMN-binding negative transcriptional regulator [Hyphomicrobiaceae bacterium]
MYCPPAFKVEETDEILDHIDRSGLAMLISNGADGPLVSHVPMVLDRSRGAHGMLAGHLAKANGHWQAGNADLPALAVFPGPDAYITPSWYPSKQEHGRVVPTWNYTVVHVRGPVRFIEDADWLRNNVSQLTDKHEGRRAEPWAVSDAPDRFIDMQLKAIVGFELEIASLEGKRKVSQNRDAVDRAGVVAGLDGQDGGAAMRDLVKAAMDKG